MSRRGTVVGKGSSCTAPGADRCRPSARSALDAFNVFVARDIVQSGLSPDAAESTECRPRTAERATDDGPILANVRNVPIPRVGVIFWNLTNTHRNARIIREPAASPRVPAQIHFRRTFFKSVLSAPVPREQNHAGRSGSAVETPSRKGRATLTPATGASTVTDHVPDESLGIVTASNVEARPAMPLAPTPGLPPKRPRSPGWGSVDRCPVGADLHQLCRHRHGRHLGAVDLAAVSIGGVIFYPVMVIGLGMCMAVSPSVAQLCGAGRRSEVAGVVRQGLWMALALACLSYIAIRSGRPLLEYFQVNPSVVPLGVRYLDALSWGMPALVLYNVLRSYCEGMGRSGPILVVSLVALPVNIVGNFAFAFGAWGCPKLGCEGLGYASALSMWVMFGGLAAFAAWHPDLARDRVFGTWVWPHPREIGHLAWVGGRSV